MRAAPPVAFLAATASAAVLLAACASAPATGAGGPSASRGESAYRARCGSCHRLHDPRERTGDEWAAQVDKMAGRARLSGDDRAAVVEYLRANARDAAGR